jgi:antitoxin MazE
MRTEEDRVAVFRKRKAREGWDDAFRLMAERGEDALLDGQITSEWDSTEWGWQAARDHKVPRRRG